MNKKIKCANTLLALLIVGLTFFMISCNKDAKTFTYADNLDTREITSSNSNYINDSSLIAVSELHNTYLSQIISSFNTNCTDKVVELDSCFMRITDISSSKKSEMLNKLNNGEICNTIDELIFRVKESDITSAPQVVYYIKTIGEIFNSETIYYDTICGKLNAIKNNMCNDTNIDARGCFFLKSLIYTLEKSSYFWLPLNNGGSGEGYDFLTSVGTRSLFGDIILADGVSISMGFLCGWFAITPIGLIVIAAEGALSSAFTGIINM